MKRLFQFAPAFFYLLFLQANKYNDESRSAEIASFLFSVYLGILVLVILLILDYTDLSVFKNKEITVYILITVSVSCFIATITYFKYKKRYLKIHDAFAESRDYYKLIKQFALFNGLFFTIFILVGLIF